MVSHTSPVMSQIKTSSIRLCENTHEGNQHVRGDASNASLTHSHIICEPLNSGLITLMIIDLTPFFILAHFVIPAENRAYSLLPPEVHGPLLAPIPILEGWAQYAPQYPVGKYSKPPQACDITQVRQCPDFFFLIDHLLGQHCGLKEPLLRARPNWLN